MISTSGNPSTCARVRSGCSYDSPNSRVKAICAAGSSDCPPNTSTRCSWYASTTLRAVSSSRGFERLTPDTSAPSAPHRRRVSTIDGSPVISLAVILGGGGNGAMPKTRGADLTTFVECNGWQRFPVCGHRVPPDTRREESACPETARRPSGRPVVCGSRCECLIVRGGTDRRDPRFRVRTVCGWLRALDNSATLAGTVYRHQSRPPRRDPP